MERKRLKPITEEQRNQIIKAFRSSKENGAPTIAAMLGVSVHQVNRVISEFLKHREQLMIIKNHITF